MIGTIGPKWLSGHCRMQIISKGQNLSVVNSSPPICILYDFLVNVSGKWMRRYRSCYIEVIYMILEQVFLIDLNKSSSS